MRILGFAGLLHDPSIALLDGGTIRMAVESEKITRHKHEVSVFPGEAIRFVLDACGLSLSQIDCIVTNWDGSPWSNRLFLGHLARFAVRGSYPVHFLATLLGLYGSHHPTAFLPLQEEKLPPVRRVRHHLAHLGSCYTVSPFDEAAVAIIDGSGEVECTSLYHCRERRVEKLRSFDLPVDSLGHVYTMATIHLGYQMLGDEYKVMGLAAYGERRPEFEQFFRELIQLEPGGGYRVDARMAGNYMRNGYRFPPATASRLQPRRHPDEPIRDEHRDFAHALQARVEEAVVHVCRHLRAVTGSRHLCLAGGVALNCVANGRLLEQTDFEEIFIQPAANDAGTSLGAAAYHLYHTLGGERPGPFEHAYLGRQYDDAEIEAELGRCRAAYRRVEDPAAAAAALLAEGKVIGWFQGRAEFGPRALGNRSILADPRDARTKDRVNLLIKERENYRPFAPALLEEAMPRFFAHITRSPYMLLAGAVRPEARALIPAVVHVDGSARPQSVSRRTNPIFYRLIEAFASLTGVPVVLNTSFNVAGEPIVHAPVHAIRCFFGSGLDALVIGSFVLEKPALQAERRAVLSSPTRRPGAVDASSRIE